MKLYSYEELFSLAFSYSHFMIRHSVFDIRYSGFITFLPPKH